MQAGHPPPARLSYSPCLGQIALNDGVLFRRVLLLTDGLDGILGVGIVRIGWGLGVVCIGIIGVNE